jgi:hypothetical protein
MKRNTHEAPLKQGLHDRCRDTETGEMARALQESRLGVVWRTSQRLERVSFMEGKAKGKRQKEMERFLGRSFELHCWHSS